MIVIRGQWMVLTTAGEYSHLADFLKQICVQRFLLECKRLEHPNPATGRQWN